MGFSLKIKLLHEAKRPGSSHFVQILQLCVEHQLFSAAGSRGQVQNFGVKCVPSITAETHSRGAFWPSHHDREAASSLCNWWHPRRCSSAPADRSRARFLSVLHLKKNPFYSDLMDSRYFTSVPGDPGRTNCKLRTAGHLLATRANPTARGRAPWQHRLHPEPAPPTPATAHQNAACVLRRGISADIGLRYICPDSCSVRVQSVAANLH